MSGNERLERFAREEADTLYSLFRRAVGDSDVAEDLVQDTLHDAWRNMERYDVSRPFRHWIIRIGLNRLRSFLRRRKLERARITTLVLEPEAGDRPEAPLVQAERCRGLDQAIALLPQRQRVAILLRYQEGLSCREIGEVLDLTENAVAIQLYRARKALRREIGEDSDGGTG